jgi:succinyl-diaminopimelate desuccinylase
MLELARTVTDPAVEVTYVFYAAEEVAAVHNGLGHLLRDRPDLLAADVALLGEPTEGVIEAGCQGTMRFEVTVHGARAHTARPWMGRNAIHRLGRILAAVEAIPERRPVIDGCEFREAVQAVAVTGGVAGNVVPDLATLTLNHRFAPDRTPGEAEAAIRAVVEPHLEDGDRCELVDVAPAAAPSLGHPVLEALVRRNDLPVRAKLGWTDVARFAGEGIPATNFGPGDPTIAHMADEHVDRASIERCYAALSDLLTTGV